MTPEQDDDFFPLMKIQEPDRIVVCESNVTYLEEKLNHLIDRAKYCDEMPEGKAAYIEALEELKFMTFAIRKSAGL